MSTPSPSTPGPSEPDGLAGAPVAPADLRVSDADREHVLGLLQGAIGRGFIDLAEFTTRTDAALAAKTRGELAAVVMDIPGTALARRFTSTEPAELTGTTDVAGTDGRVDLRCTWSFVKRRGRWQVPAEIVLRGSWSTATLDFTEAVFDVPVVTIGLRMFFSNVHLVLPAGVTVDTSAVDLAVSSVYDRIGADGGRGDHRLELRGSLKLGSISIKGAGRRLDRR